MRLPTKKIKTSLLLIPLIIIICTGIAFSERMAISGSTANIRSGPGTKYDIIWQVGKYYPVQVQEESGEWCLFKDFEGDLGWIHKSLLDKTQSVITKKKTCNVRSGPGTRHDKLFTIDKGIPFKVIGQKDNWLQIIHADGDKGWIHKSLVW